jgi:hypothetical protein
MIAVVHDLWLEQAQLRSLARLLGDDRENRPRAVRAHLLWHDGDQAQLIALWENRDALDRYLAAAEVFPVSERLSSLLRQTTTPRIVEIDAYG